MTSNQWDISVVFMHGDSILKLVVDEGQGAFQAFVYVDLVFSSAIEAS